jgi:hypothetical protein
MSSCGPEVKFGHSIKFNHLMCYRVSVSLKFSYVNLDPGLLMTVRNTYTVEISVLLKMALCLLPGSRDLMTKN